MKIAAIVGNRPQFIKAASLFRLPFENLQIKLIHSGQHFDDNMSGVFFREMELPAPDYWLGIGGLAQGAMTGRMLEKIEEILLQEKPDWTLVFGDTNTTIAASLAAVKLHLPVAHVEAGLRSFNRKMPEEINRIVTDHCSDILFTPTLAASSQLIKEGIPEKRIHQVGDVMYDTFLFYQKKAAALSNILQNLKLKNKDYILATIHRQENTDDPKRLVEIAHGLSELARKTRVIFPIHPRTKKYLKQFDLLNSLENNIDLIDPVGYFDIIQLEANASAIFTDSGGVQKEAYFCKTPCITIRDETEWVELVKNGFNRLVPPKRESIAAAYQIALNSTPDWSIKLYGSGQTSSRILKILSNCPVKNS